MDYKKRTSDPDVLIAEGAVVVGDVKLAKGVSVWYNAVLRGDESPIEVGENTNIQEMCIRDSPWGACYTGGEKNFRRSCAINRRLKSLSG